MNNFPGWEKRDGGLGMKAHPDVLIAYAPDLNGTPFVAHVGAAQSVHEDLEGAVIWANAVASGRAILLGTEPLEPDEGDEHEQLSADRRFLEERGLKS